MCHIKYFVGKVEVKQISTPISKLPWSNVFHKLQVVNYITFNVSWSIIMSNQDVNCSLVRTFKIYLDVRSPCSLQIIKVVDFEKEHLLFSCFSIFLFFYFLFIWDIFCLFFDVVMADNLWNDKPRKIKMVRLLFIFPSASSPIIRRQAQPRKGR